MTQRYPIAGEDLTAAQVWRRYIADGRSPYDFVRHAIAAGKDPVARFRAAIESLGNHPDRETIERVASEYWAFSKPGRRAGRAMMEHKRPATPETFWLMALQEMREDDPESPHPAIIEALCRYSVRRDTNLLPGVIIQREVGMPIATGAMASPVDVVWAIQAFRESSDSVAGRYEMDEPAIPFRFLRSLWVLGEADPGAFVNAMWHSLTGPEQPVDMPTAQGAQLQEVLVEVAPSFVAAMRVESLDARPLGTHLHLVWSTDKTRPYQA